jgi:hypothetical protein
MKTFYQIFIFCLSIFLTYCMGGIQQNKVPAGVLNSFKSRFPAATHVRWSMEDTASYEADFISNYQKQSALFTKQGVWFETEKSIRTSDLPLTIIQTITNGFPGFTISSVDQVENPEKGLFYDIVIKGGKEQYEVKLSTYGVILDKSVYKKDKD